jgi:hypothetical protein
MTLLKWGGLAVLCLASLLFSCPSSWLDRMLAYRTAGQWRLMDARGTIWSGSARLTRLSGDGSVQVLHAVKWSFQPQLLRSLRLSWMLGADGRPGELSWGRGERPGRLPDVLPGDFLLLMPSGEKTLSQAE